MYHSRFEIESDQDLGSTRERLLDDLGSPFARDGFGPKDFAETYLVFERRYIPWWAIVLAVGLFPIGVLFLLIKNTATLFIEFDEEATGTRINKVDGQASPEVWALIYHWDAAP